MAVFTRVRPTYVLFESPMDLDGAFCVFNGLVPDAGCAGVLFQMVLNTN